MTNKEKLEAKISILINKLETVHDIDEICKITYTIQEINLILEKMPD